MSSISSSFRSLSTKLPISLHYPKSLLPPKPFFFISKPISFQRLPSKLSSSSSPSPSSPTTPLQPVDQLPPSLQEIIKLFQSVQDPKSKYQQLLFYGKNLKPLDSQFKTRENKVEGCVSQVWVRAYLDPDKNVIFEADSDSVLTKGLAALLVQGLSGRPVEDVLRVSPDFVVLLGLQQSLTPSRNNGFLNMLKLMQKKALQLFVEAEKNSRSALTVDGDDGSSSAVRSSELRSVQNQGLERSSGEENGEVGENGLNSAALGSRGQRIKEKLERELNPIELDIEDVSYQHAGHAGVRGADGETHFNLKVVSKEFEGKSLVKRHRLIYDLLQEELQNGLHALSIVAKTPSEAN